MRDGLLLNQSLETTLGRSLSSLRVISEPQQPEPSVAPSYVLQLRHVTARVLFDNPLC